MTDSGKKIGIGIGVAAFVIVIFVIAKNAANKAAATIILPRRTVTPNTAATATGIFTQIKNYFSSAVTPVTLPSGLKHGTGSQILTVADNTPVKTFDPNTGAYQESDGTWYLEDGTALLSYDITNGTYQESDGTWYTFDGTALSYYDPTTGNYVEESDQTTMYDKNGNPIPNAVIPST
jgi:hypothetical protein